RHDVSELGSFPRHGGMQIPVHLIRRLSPDSLSITEFTSESDLRIAEKLQSHPLLGEGAPGGGRLSLGREFHMRDDSYLFRTAAARGRLPMYEGKMIHHFTHLFGAPRYWVDEEEGRRALLRGEADTGRPLPYRSYRLAFRRIARSTDERTMISTVLPRGCFTSESLTVASPTGLNSAQALVLTGILNSFVLDYLIRQRVSANLNMFFVYQLPAPRLTADDPVFGHMARRAARLVCTTPEFDDLAAEVGLGSHASGATDPEERARLRVEMDAGVAHLYGLTETEFAHILSTFPLVPRATKDATLTAYRALAPHPDDETVARMIADGEGPRVEFKEAAAWNRHTGVRDGNMKTQLVREVAGLLNAEGGSVLIGVADDGTVVGIAGDVLAADPGKPTPDGYELFLRNTLRDALGADVLARVEIRLHPVHGVKVCRITVPAAPRPVYVNGELHVRTGNQTRRFTAAEAVAYIATRFP
ncbi:MAG TPA: ATP-binding protein, partial [Longimicrobiaceae bacterium]|nr:ATP-binding protein [Longimicrobiaceae bacterium]